MSLNFKISIKERVLMEWVTLISQIKWIYKKEINMLHSISYHLLHMEEYKKVVWKLIKNSLIMTY